MHVPVIIVWDTTGRWGGVFVMLIARIFKLNLLTQILESLADYIFDIHLLFFVE